MSKHSPTKDKKITYYGSRSDWLVIRDFFGTFSNGIRKLAAVIRENPEMLRRLTDTIRQDKPDA